MDNDDSLKNLSDALKKLSGTGEIVSSKEKRKVKSSYRKAKTTTLVNTYSEATVLYQDYKIRQKYIKAVDKDIKSRKKVRKKFLNFYIWFMSIVTGLIFFVIIDPIELVREKPSLYSNSLKLALIGVFFANLISIALVMVKYSFASIDNMMDAFEKLSKDYSNRKSAK